MIGCFHKNGYAQIWDLHSSLQGILFDSFAETAKAKP